MKPETSNLKSKIIASDVEKACNIDFLEKITELNDRQFFDQTSCDLKIQKLQNTANFKTQIGIVLTKIAVLLGIKNPIDNFTKQDLLRLIVRRYKHLSPAEIYKAFENERYGINQPKTEHYQLFDSNYISTIIDRYIEWKRNEKIKINYNPPQQQTTLLLPEITDKEKHDLMTKEINRLFTTYLLQGHLDNQIIVHVYKELCGRNIIYNQADDPEKQAQLDRFFANQYQKAKEQIETEYKQKARQSSYYKQLLSEIQNNQNGGAVITQMQRNILCLLFEKNRNNHDFVKRIQN